MIDCMNSLPSAFSTATEIVLWWTSRPTYLMLFIGCSFRQAWLTASAQQPQPTSKGAPFYNAWPTQASFAWMGLFAKQDRRCAPSLSPSRQLNGNHSVPKSTGHHLSELRASARRIVANRIPESAQPTAPLVRALHPPTFPWLLSFSRPADFPRYRCLADAIPIYVMAEEFVSLPLSRPARD